MQTLEKRGEIIESTTGKRKQANKQNDSQTNSLLNTNTSCNSGLWWMMLAVRFFYYDSCMAVKRCVCLGWWLLSSPSSVSVMWGVSSGPAQIAITKARGAWSCRHAAHTPRVVAGNVHLNNHSVQAAGKGLQHTMLKKGRGRNTVHLLECCTQKHWSHCLFISSQARSFCSSVDVSGRFPLLICLHLSCDDCMITSEAI